MAANITELKQQIFFDLMNIVGRVFVLVKYSEDVVIGNRGFLPEEKEKGLVLVFNSRMNFNWDESGIAAKLVFGAATEKCFIPADSILSVFSPELSAQFVTSAEKRAESHESAKPVKPEPAKPVKDVKSNKDNKVVEVDFRKKR